MTVPSFASVAPAYAKLWDELVPTPSRVPELEKICTIGISHKATYAEVAQKVWMRNDLWWVVFLIDQMEGGGGARTHLWNGDPLSHYTVNVPAGEPKIGHGPPFTFVESAVPALKHDGMDKITEWTGASTGYCFEAYNGWGYLSKPIVSPYLASWSNKYTKGKYTADHVYDANAVSGQPGALTILKVLVTLDKSIDLSGGKPAPLPAPKKEPTVNVITGITDAIGATKTATTTAPATGFSIDFSQIEKELEAVVNMLNGSFISSFIPAQIKGVLAFAPVAEGALSVIGDLQNADWSHGSIAAILSKELRKAADTIDASVPK
jgi:lysozyme family protein